MQTKPKQTRFNGTKATKQTQTRLANPTLSPPLASRRQKGREDTYNTSGGSSGVITRTLSVGLGGGDGLLLRINPLVALCCHPFGLWSDVLLGSAGNVLAKSLQDLLVAAATLLGGNMSPVLTLCLHAKQGLHLGLQLLSP